MASWYGPGYHGNRTSNGERYDQDGLGGDTWGLGVGDAGEGDARLDGPQCRESASTTASRAATA